MNVVVYKCFMLLIILDVIFSLSFFLSFSILSWFFSLSLSLSLSTSIYFRIPNSGVATLSITDSSATSSEDASNPDSPDNSAVVNNDLLHRLNGSKCSKQNQQVPTNNNNSKHNKNEQVRIISQRIFICMHHL